jgi:hypothetical protein
VKRHEWPAFWAALIVAAIVIFLILDTVGNRIRKESAQPPLGELGPAHALQGGL